MSGVLCCSLTKQGQVAAASNPHLPHIHVSLTARGTLLSQPLPAVFTEFIPPMHYLQPRGLWVLDEEAYMVIKRVLDFNADSNIEEIYSLRNLGIPKLF